MFDSAGLYLRSGSIQHFLQMLKICFVEGLHSLDSHILSDINGLNAFAGWNPEADKSSTVS